MIFEQWNQIKVLLSCLVAPYFKFKVLDLRDLLCSPMTFGKTREVGWKVLTFVFRLLKAVYSRRQYEECQQVSAITVTYLQVKLAQLCVFLVVWHSVNSRAAVKP